MKPWWMRGTGAVALLAVLRCISVPAGPRFSVCAFHFLTGRPCPLCGLTRGLFALGKGHWHEALGFNALTPVGLVLLLSLLWSPGRRGPLWVSGLAAFGVYGALRLAVPGL